MCNGYAGAWAYVEVKGNLWELFFSFHLVGPQISLRVSGLVASDFYPLSRAAGPLKTFMIPGSSATGL